MTKKSKETSQKEMYPHYDDEGVISSGKLNEIIIHEGVRPNGTYRYALDFSNCPTLAEQHTAHLSDINYLIERYKPDELAAYIAARNQHRQEILGHDFSTEPSMQEGKNSVYRMKKAFDELDPDIKNQFKNHVEFMKFIDNPANQEKMLKLGILKKREIENLTSDGTVSTPTSPEPPGTPHFSKETKS